MLWASAIWTQHSYLRSPENSNYRAITTRNAWLNWRTILTFRYIVLSSLSVSSLSFCNSRVQTQKHTQRETSVENIFRLKCSKDVRCVISQCNYIDETRAFHLIFSLLILSLLNRLCLLLGKGIQKLNCCSNQPLPRQLTKMVNCKLKPVLLPATT